MLYEMIIMSSTSQLYCQTKMNLKKVICCQQITFLSFSAKKGHFLQWILFCKQIKVILNLAGGIRVKNKVDFWAHLYKGS